MSRRYESLPIGIESHWNTLVNLKKFVINSIFCLSFDFRSELMNTYSHAICYEFFKNKPLSERTQQNERWKESTFKHFSIRAHGHFVISFISLLRHCIRKQSLIQKWEQKSAENKANVGEKKIEISNKMSNDYNSKKTQNNRGIKIRISI